MKYVDEYRDRGRVEALAGAIARVNPDDRTYTFMEVWPEDTAVEVDATGAGCLMFDMGVFRKLPRPWFRNDKAPDGAPPIGEDIGFCQDLKAAGYKIFVDTSVPAGHLTTMVVNTATNRLYRAIKSEQAARAAIKTDTGGNCNG